MLKRIDGTKKNIAADRWMLSGRVSVGIKRKGVNIIVNAESCRINGVEVKFSSKLLVKDGNKMLVDLASIIRLMGGGIELIPNTGTINVCFCNKRIILKGALKYFHDGFFDQIVLNHIWKNEYINDSELRIAI